MAHRGSHSHNRAHDCLRIDVVDRAHDAARRPPLRAPPRPRLTRPGSTCLADDPAVQAHTYHGTPSEWLTLQGALRRLLGASTRIVSARGCERHCTDTGGFDAAITAASSADAVVYVGGLEARDEEEDTDRANFRLPGVQLALISKLAAVAQRRRVPFAVVLYSGGPLSEPTLLTLPGLDSA